MGTKLARHHITLTEKESILRETIRLLRRPESWIKGNWKCELPERTPSGKIKKRGGRQVAKKDSKGRVQYAYCLEGAVNQAIYNVLGEKRAIAVGAYHPVGSGTDELHGFAGSDPTKEVSVTEMIAEMFPRYAGDYAHNFNDAHQTKHADVLKVLRARLKVVRAALRKKRSR